jgi:type I restriction enzyme S subunit
MKDSGIEWLGEIPEYCKLVKLKYVVRDKITDGPHKTPDFLDDGYPFLSVDAIQDGELVLENCRYISKEEYIEFRKKCNPEQGDILFGKAASVGKIALINTDVKFSVWSPLALIKPKLEEIKPKFLEYSLKSNYLQYETNIRSTKNTQKNISMDDINNLSVILPPLKEQRVIVGFLDRETGRIEELIEKKENLIELLEEKRQATISQAVTKGLDSDVEMKDSGIEWLGEIPKHWELGRLKFYIKLNPTKTEIKSNSDDLEATFLPMKNIYEDGSIDTSEEKLVGEVGSRFTYFSEGDVLLAKITPCFENGKSAIAENLKNKIGFGTTEVQVLRTNNNSNRVFIYYLINSDEFMKLGESRMTGSAGQKRVPTKFIKNFRQGFPPLEEQKK